MRNISKELRKHLTLNKLLLAHKLLFATICALGSGNRDNFIVSRLRVQYMPFRNGRISWLLAGNKGIKDVWLSIIGLLWCLKPNEIIITKLEKIKNLRLTLIRLGWTEGASVSALSVAFFRPGFFTSVADCVCWAESSFFFRPLVFFSGTWTSSSCLPFFVGLASDSSSGWSSGALSTITNEKRRNTKMN